VVVVIIGTILVATLMMPLIGIMLMQVDMLLAMLVTPTPAHRSHVHVGDRSGKHRGPDQSGDVHVRSRCRRRARARHREDRRPWLQPLAGAVG
jgi:hypothetical protein